LIEQPADSQPLPEPHQVPKVLSRPELVYLYEVAAEELAPVEGGLWQDPPDEVYEEPVVPRPPQTGRTERERLLYEVAVTAGTSDPPAADAGSQAKDGVTPLDSQAKASGSRGSEPHSDEGTTAPRSDGGQGRLFEGSGN
jgi:hypothetical protein